MNAENDRANQTATLISRARKMLTGGLSVPYLDLGTCLELLKAGDDAGLMTALSLLSTTALRLQEAQDCVVRAWSLLVTAVD